MFMDHLFSPWRMNYISGTEKPQGCIFCELPKLDDGHANLIFHRAHQHFLILNRFPYTSGHVMVVPFRHVAELSALTSAERAEMMELVNQCTSVLQQIYQPQGFNIGINLGAAAGAGVAQHLHMHIVPRWVGDANFITTVGQTRVLPQSLEECYDKIIAGFNQAQSE